MKYRARRYLTDIVVTINAGDTLSRAPIRDVSPHGARIYGICNAPIGSLVTVEHLNARLNAKLCWKRPDSYGVVFTKPLDPIRLNALRAVRGGGKMQAGAPRFARG